MVDAVRVEHVPAGFVAEVGIEHESRAIFGGPLLVDPLGPETTAPLHLHAPHGRDVRRHQLGLLADSLLRLLAPGCPVNAVEHGGRVQAGGSERHHLLDILLTQGDGIDLPDDAQQGTAIPLEYVDSI